jgi:hypothetical protein
MQPADGGRAEGSFGDGAAAFGRILLNDRTIKKITKAMIRS